MPNPETLNQALLEAILDSQHLVNQDGTLAEHDRSGEPDQLVEDDPAQQLYEPANDQYPNSQVEDALSQTGFDPNIIAELYDDGTHDVHMTNDTDV